MLGNRDISAHRNISSVTSKSRHFGSPGPLWCSCTSPTSSAAARALHQTGQSSPCRTPKVLWRDEGGPTAHWRREVGSLFPSQNYSHRHRICKMKDMSALRSGILLYISTVLCTVIHRHKKNIIWSRHSHQLRPNLSMVILRNIMH